MTERKRTDEGRYTTEYRDDDFLDALREQGGSSGTLDVAQQVGCDRDTARRRLNALVDAGEVERRDVGDAALWSLVDSPG